MSDQIAEIRARHERDNRYGDGLYPGAHKDRAWLLAEVEKMTRERDEARAEVERLREALKIAASYVNSCYHAWYRPHDLAEALRDLTKIREVLNDERAGELEGKP